VKTQNDKRNVVRDARQRKQWTQLELARRTGCSESQIGKIETGRATNPALWMREAIARELGIGSWEVGV